MLKIVCLRLPIPEGDSRKRKEFTAVEEWQIISIDRAD